MEIRAPQADMPEWKVVKSMTLFAQEVMPRVQARLGQKPSLAAVS
jgi:hypothetical protein